MNITSESAHSSLAQRIAKVRNCMLVEVSTGVSPTDKDLFMSLCQRYEQSGVETSCTASVASQNALDQANSFSNLAVECSLPDRRTAMSERDTAPSQNISGFSIIRWLDSVDIRGFDDFTDWSKGGR